MDGGFVTTQWSRVLAARDGRESKARAALETLFQAYWQPLFAYVRRQGHDPDVASDLTQAYFATLLEKEFLNSVDPTAGRFRSFLLASLKNFLSHERDRERALNRGEAYRQLRRAIAYAPGGHFRVRSQSEQEL